MGKAATVEVSVLLLLLLLLLRSLDLKLVSIVYQHVHIQKIHRQVPWVCWKLSNEGEMMRRHSQSRIIAQEFVYQPEKMKLRRLQCLRMMLFTHTHFGGQMTWHSSESEQQKQPRNDACFAIDSASREVRRDWAGPA